MSDWDAAAAEWYARHYGEYATNRLAVDALPLAPNAVVIDVGCGTGAALRHAANRVTAGALIGVDPVPRMLEIARERLATHPAAGRISFSLGRAAALPLAARTADVVLAFDSFDHWSNQARGLAEATRVLKPAGRLVLVKDDGAPGGARSRRALLAALERAGFKVTRETRIAEASVSFTLWVCHAMGASGEHGTISRAIGA